MLKIIKKEEIESFQNWNHITWEIHLMQQENWNQNIIKLIILNYNVGRYIL